MLHKRMTTTGWAMALVVGLSFLTPGVNAAQTKIGFVNTPAVLEQAPQAKAASERLQSEFAARDQQLAQEAKRLKEMEEKLARDGAIMSEPERQKLERQVQMERRELKRARDAFGEDLNIRRNEEIAKLQRQVAEVVMTIAKEGEYDLILEAGVVHASERVDITGKVIDRLSKLTGAGK